MSTPKLERVNLPLTNKDKRIKKDQLYLAHIDDQWVIGSWFKLPHNWRFEAPSLIAFDDYEELKDLFEFNV